MRLARDDGRAAFLDCGADVVAGRFAGIGNEITGEGRGVYVFKKQPQHFGQLVVDG